MIYNISLVIKRLTNNLQVVPVADSGLYPRVVLCCGHTLQDALVVKFDYYGEGCNLLIQ